MMFQTVQAAREYDLLLCACGYEGRCSHVSRYLGSRAKASAAIGFDYANEASIIKSKDWFQSNGFFEWYRGAFPGIPDADFHRVVERLLFSTEAKGSETCIAVDVSSFSSIRLAHIVELLWTLGERRKCIVDFYYAPGKSYDELEGDVEIQFAGPVTGHFAGWAARPELPVVAIIGLGMELERSLGAFELINPGIVYTFETTAVTEKIAKQISRANAGLYPLVPEAQRFSYDVLRPLDCLSQLRSLLTGALKEGRPVFVPLGPKIFTVCALIIASEFHPDVGVWRISSGVSRAPINIEARGDISSFSLVFF